MGGSWSITGQSGSGRGDGWVESGTCGVQKEGTGEVVSGWKLVNNRTEWKWER